MYTYCILCTVFMYVCMYDAYVHIFILYYVYSTTYVYFILYTVFMCSVHGVCYSYCIFIHSCPLRSSNVVPLLMFQTDKAHDGTVYDERSAYFV